MILTVTPNPTLDRAVFVRSFQLGELARGTREILTPSGKGVDASLVLHALGYPTRALGLQAGRQGQLARELLDQLGVLHDFVEADGETRHALVLIDQAQGLQSTISVATLHATPAHLAALLERLDRYLPQSSGVILAGSLPRGWPTSAYRHMLEHCQCNNVLTLLDSSGTALTDALASGGTMPSIVKVNLDEFGSIAGRPLPDSHNLEALTERLITVREALHLNALVVTLGAHGLLAATSEGCWHAQPPPVPVVNTAGAGDALAGILLAVRSQGVSWPEAMIHATAAATAVVTTAGTAECDPDKVAELRRHIVLTPQGVYND